MKTIFVARHGQSEWNNQRRVTGRLDPGLSDAGRLQSHALAGCLESAPLAAIYASTLNRSVETARPTAVSRQMQITRLADLDEIDLGELQGRYRDERDVEAQSLWARWQAEPWTFRVPGAERFDEFSARVEGVFETILRRHAGESVLIVGHRATNRVLLGKLLGLPRSRWFDLRQRNRYCYRIDTGRPPEVRTLVLSGARMGTIIDGFVQ